MTSIFVAMFAFFPIIFGGLFGYVAWTDYLDHKERMARMQKETGHGDDA